MLYLRPTNHRDEWFHGRTPDGRVAGYGPTISVEADAEGAAFVHLTLEPRYAETIDDRDIDRMLDPDEALELAAMLTHAATRARQ